jgi:hypothetical protein
VVRKSTYSQYVPLVSAAVPRSLLLSSQQLRNQKERLTHGWFCVKSPDIHAGDKAPTHEQAAQQEAAYFAAFHKDQFWKELGHGASKQLGIPNLTAKLSDVLLALNEESLPKITASIKTALEETKKELAQFKLAEKGTPTSLVIAKITAFAAESTRDLGGDPSAGETGFAQKRNATWQAFQLNIHKTAPVLLPFTQGELAEYRTRYSDVELGHADEEENDQEEDEKESVGEGDPQYTFRFDDTERPIEYLVDEIALRQVRFRAVRFYF